MTESRKRPGSPVEDPTAPKKRAVVSASGSPRGVTSTDSPDATEPGEDSNLEPFRKEAIFLRMRHYAREHERGCRRIRELEAAQEQYQAGVQAIETCWNQLVAEIRALVALDDIPKSSTRGSSLKLPKVASEITAYETAVQERREATKSLVSAFVAKAGSDPPPEVLSIHAARRKAESEAEQLRSEHQILQSRLEDANEQLYKLRSDLEAAEIRADRIKRESLQAVAPAVPRPDEGVEQPVKREPSSPPAGMSNGKEHMYDEAKAERARTNSLEATVKRQVDEIVQLQAQVNALEFRLKVNDVAVNGKNNDPETWPKLYTTRYPSLPYELEDLRVVESDAYKRLERELREKASREEQLVKEKEALDAVKVDLENKISSLQTTCQTDYEVEIDKLLAAQEEKFKSRILRLTEDTARLRAERDAKDVDLAEKRAILEAKFSAIKEMRILVESREERILSLQSEVKRLKGRLAAGACDEDLYNFLRVTEDDDGPAYVQSLKTRLRAAEDKVKALQDSLAFHMSDDGKQAAVESEVEIREQYEVVRRRLERYVARFGPDADASVLALSQQLEAKEKALAEVELLRKQESEALDASFNEIERLSSSWEMLDRQVKSKVLDLSNIERTLTQLTAEKARSDNKYFAARSNADITNHKIAALETNIQRQLQLITTLKKYEEESKQVISGHEIKVKELTHANNSLREHRRQLDEQLLHVHNRRKWQDDEIKSLMAAKNDTLKQLQIANTQADTKSADLDKERDKVAQLERQISQSRKTASALANSSDVQKQLEKSMGVIKCSTCKQNFREQTLAKCGHTFCKSCLDSRISTRQRKCPACNLPFAQSEVISIFLQ